MKNASAISGRHSMHSPAATAPVTAPVFHWCVLSRSGIRPGKSVGKEQGNLTRSQDRWPGDASQRAGRSINIAIVGRQLMRVGVELVDTEGDDPLGGDPDQRNVQPTEGLGRAADL